MLEPTAGRAPKAILMAVALIVGLAACSGGSAPSSSKTLVVAITGDAANLDPTASAGNPAAAEIMKNVYTGLIKYDVGPDDKGQPIAKSDFVGSLAESWQQNADGTQITFKLRSGLKFANGDPIDAAAVLYTFQRIFAFNTTSAGLFSSSGLMGASSVVAVDNSTVQFTLAHASTLFMQAMVQYSASIVDPKVVMAHATSDDPWGKVWMKTNTTGTEDGPYVLQSVQPSVQYVLQANPNFYGPAAPVSKVIMRVVPDTATRETLLQSGAVDAADSIPLADLPRLQGDPNLTVNQASGANIAWLGLDIKKPPLDNLQIRQAFAYALPYDTIISDVLKGYGVRLTGLVPTGVPLAAPSFTSYTTDIAKAKALLTQAGHPNGGVNVTMSVSSGDPQALATSVWVKSEEAMAGINVTINQVADSAYQNGLFSQQYQISQNLWDMAVPDMFMYYSSWFTSKGCCNYSAFSDPNVDQLVAQNFGYGDQTARQAASTTIQQEVMSQAFFLPLFSQDLTYVTRKNITGTALFDDGYTRFFTMSKS